MTAQSNQLSSATPGACLFHCQDQAQTTREESCQPFHPIDPYQRCSSMPSLPDCTLRQRLEVDARLTRTVCLAPEHAFAIGSSQQGILPPSATVGAASLHRRLLTKRHASVVYSREEACLRYGPLAVGHGCGASSVSSLQHL